MHSMNILTTRVPVRKYIEIYSKWKKIDTDYVGGQTSGMKN